MRILVIGDTHMPFVKWEVLKWIAEYDRHYKSDLIVQIGDFTDQHVWSKYDADPDALHSHAEWDATEAAVARFAEIFKRKTVKILLGNHDARIFHRALGVRTPQKFLRTFSEIFPYDNFDFHLTTRPLVLDKVHYMHGHEVKNRVRAIQKVRATGISIVQGHTHQAVIDYSCVLGETNFGMEVGCTMDTESYAANYARPDLSTVWIGLGTVTDGVPALVPFG